LLGQATLEEWRDWAEEQRRQLPEAWPASGDRRQRSDGSEIELRARKVDFDPLEPRITLQMRSGLWQGGELVAEEERALQENLYFRDELLRMLEQAGFSDVTAHAGYTETPATAEDGTVVFVARK
jgi:hypothetical protein